MGRNGENRKMDLEGVPCLTCSQTIIGSFTEVDNVRLATLSEA